MLTWLQETAPPFQGPNDFSSEGGWEYTERKARQERLTGIEEGGMVFDLDPDAPLRQSGRTLAPLDVQAERNMNRTVYEYLRRGQMDEACDYLRKCGQGWKVASIQGGKLDHHGLMINRAEKVKKRTIWRSMCYRLAKDDRPEPYERATYSLLSGDITGSLQMCTRWEDAVHAFVNGVLECKYQVYLNQLFPSEGGRNEEVEEMEKEGALLLPHHGEDLTLSMIMDQIRLLNQPKMR